MCPALMDGEIVLVEPLGSSVIQKGDVVLYSSLSETAVIHRVVGFSENSYGSLVITRGDCCSLEDVPIPAERVLGRVIAVKRDGRLTPFVTPRISLFVRARRLFHSILDPASQA